MATKKWSFFIKNCPKLAKKCQKSEKNKASIMKKLLRGDFQYTALSEYKNQKELQNGNFGKLF